VKVARHPPDSLQFFHAAVESLWGSGAAEAAPAPTCGEFTRL
jgi:hypothetical protein